MKSHKSALLHTQFDVAVEGCAHRARRENRDWDFHPTEPTNRRTMLEMLRRSIVVVTLAAALVAALAAPAWAPRTWLLPSIQGVACTLPEGETGSFSGEITVDRFVAGRDGPEAFVQLAGTCVTASGTELQVDSNLLRIPVAIVTASCDRLDLLLGPAVDESRDGYVTIDPFKVTLDNADGSKRLGAALCSTSRVVARAPIQAQVAALNRVLNAS